MTKKMRNEIVAAVNNMTVAEMRFYKTAPHRLYSIEKHLANIDRCLTTLTEVAKKIYMEE